MTSEPLLVGPFKDEKTTGVPQDRSILSLCMAHRRELVNCARGIVGDRARAEDAVQEAWLRFGAAAEGRPLDRPVGSLYRVVRNLALDGRRRLKLEGGLVEPDSDGCRPGVLQLVDGVGETCRAGRMEASRKVAEHVGYRPASTPSAAFIHHAGVPRTVQARKRRME